ncbi:MAG: hypothetical protein KF850_08580 [Labilithrix sp.]|nr:hypothetical protein [Labilithrix sp.]
MTTDRILAIADAFDELRALVTSEPGLSSFAEVVTALVAVGEQARLGQPVQVVVIHDASARIPTVELASQILAIVNRTPGPSGLEDATTTRTIGVLHANLARAVVYTLFKDYPELMRGRVADDESEGC